MTIEDMLKIFENFYAFEHNKKLLLKIDRIFYPIQIKEENGAVVAIYNEKLEKKYKKNLKQNKYLKELIKKMKCCQNCGHYETTEDYRACRDKCVKIKNGQWILTNWKLYKN